MPFALADLAILAQVLMIDLVLAGDNAIVIGLAVARLPKRQQRQAILIGVGAATAIRIALALVALRLLAVIGLMLAGGILLLYVAWKSWREFSRAPAEAHGAAPMRLRDAAIRIVIADLSMSLDNVLAVAGAARNRPALLAVGLVVSVALMGIAANVVAKLLTRHRWLVWVGLAIVLYVALDMIHAGLIQIAPHIGIPLPRWFS
ncbi:YjbE family putative metal transport protein [Acidiphilium sp. AL]|uniref:YjbE family putative metal transport protein n=1 Tax=Acidiphilium sp. AL TaxID=2871704 RepID=UPI0021CB218C|nr:YjbE family putative metal transport protein [Acidiphilium sp. AL]MCU4161530.1 YjbE family putative metal transport protein [Acidiphilium sp. AL]